jgi:hypothetical protein
MATPIVWSDPVEKLCLELTDEAQVRSRIHMKQHMYYRCRNQLFTLPVVILSVISGSGSFISEGYTDLTKKYMIMGIGTLSIFISIVSAVSQFLKLAQNEEANRMAALAWGKFYSRIRFQLYLKRKDRDSCHDFLQSIFSEYDRLYEISPPLLSKFIKHVRKKLRGQDMNGFKLPYYMNGVERMVKHDEYEDNTFEDDEKEDVV